MYVYTIAYSKIIIYIACTLDLEVTNEMHAPNGHDDIHKTEYSISDSLETSIVEDFIEKPLHKDKFH